MKRKDVDGVNGCQGNCLEATCCGYRGAGGDDLKKETLVDVPPAATVAAAGADDEHVPPCRPKQHDMDKIAAKLSVKGKIEQCSCRCGGGVCTRMNRRMLMAISPTGLRCSDCSRGDPMIPLATSR